MTHYPRILIQHINFILPSSKPLFNDLSLTFSHCKTGLVGKNGIGKSSLIKLITGDLYPNSGTIQVEGRLAYVPQQTDGFKGKSIANLLGYEEKLRALQNIKDGSTDSEDYTVLNEEWDLEECLKNQLALFGLQHFAFNTPVEQLSGGEMTRLLLTKTFSSQADILLLDEPTNHLDNVGRQQLYNAIEQYHGALIVISHDRTLLNLLDEIIELNSRGAFIYGGNFDDYAKQKEVEKNAADSMLQARREILDDAKKLVQIRRERHERAQAKGVRAKKAEIKAKGCYDKLGFKSAKGRSERTNRRIRMQGERKLELIENQLQEAKNKIEIVEEINLNIPATHVPNGKMILEIENLNFSYQNSFEPIIKNFNLKIMGPERISLIGPNGSGKTTLVKIILKQLENQPLTAEKIYLGTNRISYLDQNASLLNYEQTILNNFLHFNPSANENEAYATLAKFLFKNETVKKKVENLSGGEKLRALLACTLMSNCPPQLLILDEPTNHLDLDSIKSIESALKAYQGAMIVISHDVTFLSNIDVVKKIYAPFVT